MADKKATVYIIDVSPTMWHVKRDDGRTALELAKQALLRLLEAKAHVMAGLKSDLTSLIVCGADETDNDLYNGSEAYKNISVLYPISQPLISILRTVNDKLTRGNVQADALNAITLASNMINQHCRQLKYTKKIYLLTDGESPMNFDDPYSDLKRENKSDQKVHNEEILQKLCEASNGTLFTLPEALSQLSKPHIRQVKFVASYRGQLTLNDPSMHPERSLAIEVEAYTKTMKSTRLTAKKYSTFAESATNQDGKTCEVNMSRTFSITVNEDGKTEIIDVSKEELDKAYLLGKTFIPVTNIEEGVLSLNTTQSFSILGFIRSNQFKREYLLDKVYTIVPPKNNYLAANYLSALIHGLYEKETYALVRYVRRNFEAPKLGVLAPHITPKKECLYFSFIPFKEDRKYIELPSLERIFTTSGRRVDTHPNLPSVEVLDKMEIFIKGMDLMEAAVDNNGNPKEHLKLKECYNPTLYALKKAIAHKALNPDTPIPALDSEIISQTKLLPTLAEKNKVVVEELKKLLNVKKAKEKGKTAKRRFAEANKPAEAEIPISELLSASSEEQTVEKRARAEIDVDSLLKDKNAVTREVGATDPISDFNNMISYREEDLVTISQMAKIILDLVKISFWDSHYPKALECLKLLRTVASRENEVESYNNFLRELKNLCVQYSPPKTDFWTLVVRDHLTLISSEEAMDSTVSKSEAEEFLSLSTAAESQPPADDEEGIESLLRMLDD
ncbi:21496_t:CDS:10 [Entrophospora sp. SA101]|nr:21496_t:CDS:10 [Entrophospora sp. SA101]